MALAFYAFWLREWVAVHAHIILHFRQSGVSLVVVEISKMGPAFHYLI